MMATTMDSTVSRPSSGIVSPKSHMRSRAQSISSDRPSTTMGHGLMSPPLSVSPEAAYIAASAASQIVTNDHDSHADTWYDQHGIEPAGETALVSPGALQLVNNFLDQLLFNFLLVSRATTLTALRPAVSEVLKPKLAKDAINQADEELREYLGGGDEEDFVQPHGADPSRDWDLELVWKRTRLRCMVYSSLGDMEEEDEDYYMEHENLELGSDERDQEVISPAVAIFLTSILEYMGEQALIVAGQTSYHRMQAKYEKELKDGTRSPTEIADRIVVEDLDMERVALDRTLGRLWRAWKKRIRSPTLESGRPFSRGSTSHFRQNSITGSLLPRKRSEDTVSETEPQAAEGGSQSVPDWIEEHLRASAIPLPIGDHDIDEIEVPGLVSYSDDEVEEEDGEDEDEAVVAPPRPRSLIIIPRHSLGEPHEPTVSQLDELIRPVQPSRKRSNSLPTPAPFAFSSHKRAKVEPVPAKDSDESNKEDDTPEATVGQTTNNVEPPSDSAEPAQAPPPAKETKAQVAASRLSQIITGTAAVGTAAAARGTVPRTEVDEAGDEPEDVESDEEPQILTSSRVSIGGRSSPAISETGRPAPVNVKMPQRTPSVHSARIIDVSGPKSPVPRSATPSQDGGERSRPVSFTRTSGNSTPPILEEKPKPIDGESVKRAAASIPASRSPMLRQTRQAKTQSISEAEEDAEALSVRAESTPTTGSIPTPTSATVLQEQFQTQLKPAQPIHRAVVLQPAAPRQEAPRKEPVAPTKVTILSSSTSSGAFVEDDLPAPPPPKPRSAARAPAANPVLPERSSPGRHVSASHSPTSSIGVVSIDRRGPGRDSPERSREDYGHSSFGAAPRPIHTSGSSGSSGTGRVRPVRTSEESGSIHAENVARTFEELIQSDQTIQYTLTPENMRDIESNKSLDSNRSGSGGSPLVRTRSRRSDEARAVGGDRSRSNSEAKRTGSVSFANGLSSRPISELETSPKTGGYIPKAPQGGVAGRHRAAGPQARDARVPRESMVDIAEFIRSTGPTGDNGPTPLRNFAASAASAKNSIDSRRVSSTSTRTRLQARDAAVDGKEDNSDLIDFIRRGPPSASNNPRIPRTVAPFRSTMDSDQMSGAVGGKAVDASLPDIRYSQASTSVTDATQQSTQSSINSQSALLRGRSNGHSTFGDEDMMPKRKTRRVRDPYAIDVSDDDEEDYPRQSNRSPAKQEESLADFLKNYTPPPEPVQTAVSQNKPRKKASAPSLIGRFTRGSSSTSTPTPSAASIGVNGIDSRSVASRTSGGRGYIPIQVTMPPGYDKYGMIDNSIRPPLPKSTSTGRVPMKKFEPREAVSSSTRTSDLAAFLRSSEPPPDMTSAGPYSPSSVDETSAGISKMFGRRKKSTAA